MSAVVCFESWHKWVDNVLDCFPVCLSAGAPLLEGTCRAGELVFVPKEWWHATVNLEDDTFAITQNCVTPGIVTPVRWFLKYRRDQVSGNQNMMMANIWEFSVWGSSIGSSHMGSTQCLIGFNSPNSGFDWFNIAWICLVYQFWLHHHFILITVSTLIVDGVWIVVDLNTLHSL